MMSRWGIRSKVLLMALTPPLLIALCLGLYLVQTRISGLEDSLVARGNTIANQLAPASEYGVFNSRYDILQDLSDAALGERDVKTVTITDAKGRLLAQSRRHLAASLQQALVGNMLKLFIRDDIQLSFKAPIKRSNITSSRISPEIITSSEQNIIGWVTVELSLTATTYKQAQALLDSVLITFFIVIASALVGMWTSRTVTAPILKLTEAVQDLEKGHLETRVDENSGGEIGTLQHGFNTMATALQQAHDELQEKVEHATMELRETLEAVEIQNVELDIARKKALEASKVKSEFLANMSHEIRTPINGILGFTDLLAHTQLNDEQLDYVNTIKESGANLLAIINDILDFSKIEAGKLVIDNVAFDLRDCVEEVLSLLAPAAYGKNLELVHLIYSDVPLKLYGDPIRIRQVLTNLVHNAIKFTPSGRVVVRVMLDEDNEKESLLRLTVADTGIGLSDDDQKKLFNAFSQADTSTTRRFGGAGLGLVISKKLVEQMGGTVGLESETDKGSTFWFTLRMAKQRGQDEAPSRKDTPLKGRRLLLLDEMPLSRLALRHIFEAWEIVVSEIDSKQSFLSLLSAHESWDLAVIGLSRSDLTNQVFRNIMQKVRNYNVPLIALANTVDRNELRNLFQQGAQVSLPKSIRRQTLYREICRLLLNPQDFKPFYPEEEGTVIPFQPNRVSQEKSDNRLKVLVVDDNRINRKLASTLVAKQGAAVSEAENGQEALNIATNEAFDIILMDIHMPLMNGEEAGIKIREHYTQEKISQPRIIALTANAMPGEKDRLLSVGMDDCLIKPITEEQLSEQFRKYLNNKEGSAVNASIIGERVAAKPQNRPESSRPKTPCYDNGLANELLTMLKAELPVHRQNIESDYNNSDFGKLQDSVHKLHGAASVCAVPELKEATEELENMLRAGETEGVDEAYEIMISEIDCLIQKS